MPIYLQRAGMLCFLVFFTGFAAASQRPATNDNKIRWNESDVQSEIIAPFLKLLTMTDNKVVDSAILKINKNWKEAHEIMLLETIYYIQHPKIANKLVHLLERKTEQKFGNNYHQWLQYIWNKKATYSDSYFEFKAKVHESMDPKFNLYFSERQDQATIRLDEVQWGGVVQDGIPPLRNPKMISAKEATYLKKSDIIFGIEVNGDARAYPKRILAWHEMFVDTVGEIPVAGVYCTLCGTVILYKTEHENINYELGTSGFLYRSNKLMYDKKTQSLWSTMEGTPVIGPLVGKGIELEYSSVVTTTWGEWKKRHPETAVLSLNTGYRRNYDEGVAYADYFATDDLMFNVPKTDKSLKNKDEILAIRLPDETDENLAISSRFLKKNPVYQSKIGTVEFVVFTDKSQAHRVYKSNSIRFKDYDASSTAIDDTGRIWSLSEEKLETANGKELERIPTHNAFWFGYKAAFPDVKLVK